MCNSGFTITWTSLVQIKASVMGNIIYNENKRNDSETKRDLCSDNPSYSPVSCRLIGKELVLPVKVSWKGSLTGCCLLFSTGQSAGGPSLRKGCCWETTLFGEWVTKSWEELVSWAS